MPLEIVVSSYPASPLDLEEKEALAKIIASRTMSAALRKHFTNKEDYCTQQARNALNQEPKDLHEAARLKHQAHKFAAMSKAYGTAWEGIKAAAE